MISRDLGAGSVLARVAIAATVLLASTAWAQGPSYTYIGLSYEWTDVKYGINPNDDPTYNHGTFQGGNLDLSLGILSWLHIAGQYFSGDCDNCSNSVDSNGQFTAIDMDFEGLKVGLGFNFNLNEKETTDFVIRANYIDVELDRSDVPPAVPQVPNQIDGDGYSVEIMIRSQISEKADVMIGYEYQNIDQSGGQPTVKNRDLLVGIGYRVTKGLSLNGNAIVFDNDTGFSLGIRYYFDSLWGRDSFVR